MNSITILNTLIEPSWFADQIIATLSMYDRGDDASESPLIRFMRESPVPHASCSEVADFEAAIQQRQKDVFTLYESIKKDGYNGSEVLCFFDAEGLLQVYDGHHRLTILRMLGIETKVNVKTEWVGINGDAHSPQRSTGFPLRERLTLDSGRVRVYQPIDDDRVSDIPVERKDTEGRLAWIKERLAPGSVFDIGCSEGYFTQACLKEGRVVTSVDIDYNLTAVCRYLMTRDNLKSDVHTGRWQDVIESRCHFGNVLYLSVLHNEVNAIGEEKAFAELEKLRGRAERMFVEVPDLERQPDWSHVFTPEKIEPQLEQALSMKIVDRYDGERPIYMLVRGEIPRFEEVQTDVGALQIPLTDTIIRSQLKRSGTWEENTSAFLRSILKPGMTFFDVGAHAGYFTVMASGLVGPDGTVVSFEPDETNFECLEKNTSDCDNVIAVNAAVTSISGLVTLYRKPDAGHHTLLKSDNVGTAQVTAWTLDDYAKDHGIPDVVKIDVEGAEGLVLDGMADLLAGDKLKAVICEDWADGQGLSDRLSGFNETLKSRADGTVCMTRDMPVKRMKEKLVCHLVGNIDIPTVKGGVDAFATKCVYFAEVLKRLGHKVIFYGNEESVVPSADEFVQILSSDELESTYGEQWRSGNRMKRFDETHMKFLHTVSEEILKRRVGVCDLLLLSGGTNHAPIVKETGMSMAIEIGIGYVGSFAPYRVFESHAWRHWTYGKQGLNDGRFCDSVIPPFFDPDDFTFSQDKEDYYLYIGRVIRRKGVHIATDTVQAIGGHLKIAGPRSDASIVEGPGLEYVGIAGPDEKRELISKAKAVFIPTTYLEPFGYVVIEAALSGTPVITTDFGSFTENVRHGVTGYRCRSLEQFVWAAKNVGNIDPIECLNWGLEHSIDAAVPRYGEYFDQLLNLFGKGWYARNPGREGLSR